MASTPQPLGTVTAKIVYVGQTSDSDPVASFEILLNGNHLGPLAGVPLTGKLAALKVGDEFDLVPKQKK